MLPRASLSWPRKAGNCCAACIGVAAGKIEVIPHGTPDCAFVEPDEAKTALGFGGRPVILTFGLLSPSKGIEVMIDAMPEILRTSADGRLRGARSDPPESDP